MVWKAVAGIAGAACVVAAGVAGSGILQASSGAASPPGSSAAAGMERQIVSGERAGAATHRNGAARATVPVVKPGVPAAPKVVAGSQVTAIGDSVMAASGLALAAVMPGIYIDAQPSRQWPAGLDVVRSLAAAGRLRPVVVVGLGTNYIVTTGQLNELMRLIGPHRKLVLINTYVPDAWSRQVNATEAAFVKGHPQIVLADWYDLIRNQMYLLWPDHIHPQIPGTKVYAAMVCQAVRATSGVALAAQRR